MFTSEGKGLMFTQERKSVEIIVPKRCYQSLIEEWFDNLEDGEVKRAILQIRWREIKPPLSWFRLVVVCQHPFKDEVEDHAQSREQEDVDVIAEAAGNRGG
jgi:hypothetical protein